MVRLLSSIDYLWRMLTVRVCFIVFGVGALILGYTILPLVRLLTADKLQKDLRAQHAVSISFRFFVWLMQFFGIAQFNFKNFERLADSPATLLISNHPTLIDYVIIVSRLQHCYTLLKADASNNPFMRKVIQMTGYISNADPKQAYEEIQDVLGSGQNLLMFPEGTRSTAGQVLKLQRGAANIALRMRLSPRIIRINCEPHFLTKESRWYTVPRRKVQFSIEVGEIIDIEPFLQIGGPLSLAARQLTEVLTQTLTRNRANDNTESRSETINY